MMRKKIGGGWQYTVYDIGDGRVYKKYKNKFKRCLYILFHSKTSLFNIWSEVVRMDEEVSRSLMIVKEGKIPLGWLAHPVLLSEYDYTQDKVVPLLELFQKSNSDVFFGKKVVDMFVDFAQKLLEKGFIDLSFRASTNFGINNNGDVVLIDIGEIVCDVNRIKAQQKARYWHLPYINSDIKNKEVRDYFRLRMDQVFGL